MAQSRSRWNPLSLISRLAASVHPEPHQNTRQATTTSWSRAKITLPVHPRFGEEVAVQWSDGARAVRIETEQHLRLIVPLAWTDLKPGLPQYPALMPGRLGSEPRGH
jgi:hypothetical protein